MTLAGPSGQDDARDKKESVVEADSKPGTLRFILLLSDGSRIVGEPSVKEMPVQTSYAELKLPLALIATVGFGKEPQNVSVVLQNGDKLQGVTTLEEIPLRALFGEVAIPLKHLRSIQVEPKGQPPPAPQK